MAVADLRRRQTAGVEPATSLFWRLETDRDRCTCVTKNCYFGLLWSRQHRYGLVVKAPYVTTYGLMVEHQLKVLLLIYCATQLRNGSVSAELDWRLS